MIGDMGDLLKAMSTSAPGAAKCEPAAEVRQAAAGIRQVYVALRDEGFGQDEALTLTLGLLRMGAGGGPC